MMHSPLRVVDDASLERSFYSMENLLLNQDVSLFEGQVGFETF